MFSRRNAKARTPLGKVKRYGKKKRRKAVTAEKDKGHGGGNHLQQSALPVSFLLIISYTLFSLLSLILSRRCKSYLPQTRTRGSERPRRRSAKTVCGADTRRGRASSLSMQSQTHLTPMFVSKWGIRSASWTSSSAPCKLAPPQLCTS